ncbi:D(4) dopamine receptor-like isoform X2 [Narcine bancroftii]|uniref:D(4) dopamine receptor-like isoform X2 n=1 Tax=Narcine bancroftii TaxID=1343680 RepID=UPI003831899E
MYNLSGADIAPGSRVPGHNVPALMLGGPLILLIVSGNLLVCLSVCTERPLRTATNIFIASLAISDLLLALLVLPLYVFQEFQGGVWTLGPGLCDYLMTMDVMLCTASIFNLCAISVDRFIAVSIPLTYSRKHVDLRHITLLSLTWVLAFAVASPIAFGLNHVADRDPSVCQLENSSYIIWSSVCSFVLPCPVMLLLYGGMLRGLTRWEQARSHRLQRNKYGFSQISKSPSDHQSQLAGREQLPFPDPVREQEQSLQTLSPMQLKYVQPGCRKPARINGREHKAMKVLPFVVGSLKPPFRESRVPPESQHPAVSEHGMENRPHASGFSFTGQPLSNKSPACHQIPANLLTMKLC